MILEFALIFLFMHCNYTPNYQNVHSKWFCVFLRERVARMKANLLSAKRGISHGY